MKIFLLSLAIFLLFPNWLFSRDKGWVPLPQKADSPLLKNKNTSTSQKKSHKGEKSAQLKNKTEITTVYDNQKNLTEPEILVFINLLPQFRAWAKQNGEEAHPIITQNGKPDFLYSSGVATWINNHNFETSRFLCIMGKLAAGMVIIEEGNDFNGTRPRDMPSLTPAELELVRKHMDKLLAASKNL